MPFFEVDPLTDSRWQHLVETHSASSVFHSTEWLTALSDTYGYRPFVLTTCDSASELTDGVPFCEVRSWITGKRAVALPFSDHAEPLLSEGASLGDFLDPVRSAMAKNGWKYVEFRPLCGETALALRPSKEFRIHLLDLTPPLDQLFRNMHKNSIQRRIRKAEREQLTYERGRSSQLIDEFFRLQVITRRRHRVLPQPHTWFKNLVIRMKDKIDIRVVRKNGQAVAALLAVYHRRKAVYKYGCSDEAFHNLAGMPLLFWKLIEECKSEGFTELDFGRTEMENEGLLRFKDELGARRKPLHYYRFPEATETRHRFGSYLPIAGSVCSRLPDSLLCSLGGAVYRHVG